MKALFDKLYAKIEMDLDTELAPAEHDAISENTVPEPVEPVEAPAEVENNVDDAKAEDEDKDEDTEMQL